MSKQAETFFQLFRDRSKGLHESLGELKASLSVEDFFTRLVEMGQKEGFNFDTKEAREAFETTFEEVTGSKTKLERLFSPHPLDEPLEGEELEIVVSIEPLELMRGVLGGSFGANDAAGAGSLVTYCWTGRKWRTKKCS